MGKAVIVSEQGEGLYTARIEIQRERIEDEIHWIDTELAELSLKLADAETALATHQADLDIAIDVLNQAIQDYAASVEVALDYSGLTFDYAAFLDGVPAARNLAGRIGESPDLAEAQTVAVKVAAERDKARVEVQRLKIRVKVLQDRKTDLASVPGDVTRAVWCADYTEGLTGDVGTCEIPGEGQDALVIVPEMQLGAGYTPARDGVLGFREGMTGPQAYYNAAILPGWQRWMPTFRVGVISAIDLDADTCTVTLDAATSSAQGLGINASSVLTDVPVVYMQCNAGAFENGDRVLVQFLNQSWESPRVIGFEREPKACAMYAVIPIWISYADGASRFGEMSHSCYPDLPAGDYIANKTAAAIVLTTAWHRVMILMGDKEAEIAAATTRQDLVPDAWALFFNASARNSFYALSPTPSDTFNTYGIASSAPFCEVIGSATFSTVPWDLNGADLIGFMHSASISGTNLTYDYAVREANDAGLYTYENPAPSLYRWRYHTSRAVTDLVAAQETFALADLPDITIGGKTYEAAEFVRVIQEDIGGYTESPAGGATFSTPIGNVATDATYQTGLSIVVRYQ